MVYLGEIFFSYWKGKVTVSDDLFTVHGTFISTLYLLWVDMNVQYTEGLPDLPPFHLRRLHFALHWFHMEQHSVPFRKYSLVLVP